MTLRNYLILVFLCASPLFAAENIKAVGAVAKANVKAIGAVAEANIKAVGAVDNTSSGGGGITFEDQASHITIETAGTDTLSLTLATGLSSGYIVVGIGLYDGADKSVSGVTFDGGAMTLLESDNRDYFGEVRVYLFGLAVANKGAGSYNVVATLSGGGGVDQFVMGAASYSGVHQTVSVGTPVDENNENTSPSATVSSASGELVVGMFSNSSETLTLGDETLRWDEDDATNHAGTFVEEAGAASVTIDGTLSGSQAWLVAAIPLKPL